MPKRDAKTASKTRLEKKVGLKVGLQHKEMA
jgi:hypothetical protein